MAAVSAEAVAVVGEMEKTMGLGGHHLRGFQSKMPAIRTRLARFRTESPEIRRSLRLRLRLWRSHLRVRNRRRFLRDDRAANRQPASARAFRPPVRQGAGPLVAALGQAGKTADKLLLWIRRCFGHITTTSQEYGRPRRLQESRIAGKKEGRTAAWRQTPRPLFGASEA